MNSAYQILTHDETVARICAGEIVDWLTLTDDAGTYEAAVEYPHHCRKPALKLVPRDRAIGIKSTSLSEREILEKHSTEGLRRNILTRAGKRWHLYDMRKKYEWSLEDIEQILNELYPEEDHNG